MYQLLYLLRDVIQLRRGPQDAPHSPGLLVALCAASLVLQLAIARLLKVEGETLGAGILALAFNLGLLYLLLSVRKLSNRFVQAAFTLLGVAIVFQLLSLPIVIWKLIVDAHVLRHSLDLPFLSGLVIAVCWIIAELILGAALGGGAPAAT